VFWGDPKQQVLSDPQSLNSYSYANDNPITKSDPNGRDATTYSVGITGELGFGACGGGSASIGFGIIYNPQTGQRWIAFPVISYGATVGTPNASVVTAGKDQKAPFILGAYAGGGFSFGYSPQVTDPTQLLNGPAQDTSNFNAPFGSVSVSGEGTPSATYGFGGGAKGVASVSTYPTRTVGASYSYGTIASYAQAGIVRGTAMYTAAVQQIQSRVGALSAQVAALVAAKNAGKVQ
jgi:hypothetical protein